MDKTYCKNDYSKTEVNVVETTETRLQKMKKNVAIVSFYCYCLVSKILKEILFDI